MRRFLFWCHLVAGVSAGIVVLIMSITGVALTYERQMAERIDGPPLIDVPVGARPLAIDSLMARAEIDLADVVSIAIAAEPAKAVTVRLRDRKVVHLDPYRGAVIPVPAPRIGPFFRLMTDWHRWLGQAGDGRAVGRAITGFANLAFLFIVVSGFYLWWPRGWTWRRVRQVMVPSLRLAGKARDFNWHNAIGFWCAPALFVVVLSATFISYRWPAKALNAVFGDGVPAASPAAPADSTPVPLDLDRLLGVARRQVPGWHMITLSIPSPGDSAVRLSVTTSAIRRPTDRAQLTLGGASGAVLAWQPYDSLGPTRRVQGWMRFLHTGEALGAIGQTVAGIASLGAVVLVWTGLALTWRRFRSWRRRSERAAGSGSDEGEEANEVLTQAALAGVDAAAP